MFPPLKSIDALLLITLLGCSIQGKPYYKEDSFRKTQIGDDVIVERKDGHKTRMVVMDVRNDSIFGDADSISFTEVGEIRKVGGDDLKIVKVAATGFAAGVVFYVVIGAVLVISTTLFVLNTILGKP